MRRGLLPELAKFICQSTKSTKRSSIRAEKKPDVVRAALEQERRSRIRRTDMFQSIFIPVRFHPGLAFKGVGVGGLISENVEKSFKGLEG